MINGGFSSLSEQRKIVTAERVIDGNKMVETCKNSNGDICKVSVFLDRNGDGKFDATEAVSVKYIDANSYNRDTVEYVDTDNDGFCDEIHNSDWRGNETITKETPDEFQGKNHRMDFKYGFKWDATGPMYVLGQE
jgi:hypothetical protein